MNLFDLGIAYIGSRLHPNSLTVGVAWHVTDIEAGPVMVPITLRGIPGTA